MNNVAPIAQIELSPAAQAQAVSMTEARADFGQLVTQGLNQVSQALQTSQSDMQQLASGQVSNLHQIMIRLEESRLAFQTLLTVRNRALESFQEVMRMQI